MMSSTPPPDESKTKNTPPPDFGWNIHQSLNQLIGFADAKAGALLAAAVAISGVLLLNKPTHSLSGSTIIYGLALLCLALCAACAGCAFLPFIPCISRRDKGTTSENNENLVSWKSIRKVKDYKGTVKTKLEVNSDEINDAYAEENHQISKELRVRFALVEGSIVLLMIGLVFAGLFFLFPTM